MGFPVHINMLARVSRARPRPLVGARLPQGAGRLRALLGDLDQYAI